MLKCLYSFTFIVLVHIGLAQENDNCAGMEPICTSAGLSFTSNANVTGSEPGNDYGCLSSQPNPSWYYFEIATNGNIDMSLSAGSDIDFIIYGPFADLTAAQNNCGTLGDPINSPIVDCSYSGTNMETPSIPNAIVGEVYILLITNFANIVQDISLTQTGGTGSTDCSIVPPCDATVGSFSVLKNNILVTEPIVLCEGDNFEIRSQNNYVLPADTISGPTGDGIYTAQLMFLVYNALPTGTNPLLDPAYTQLIIPEDSLFDIHDQQSTVINTLGCGTYYFVPITADDGIGQNNNLAGPNDNGTIFWDTDGNGCFELGDPFQVTYTCDLTPIPVVSCTGLNNGVDFNFPEAGTYNITNTGNGSLLSNLVTTPSLAQVENLSHGQTYSISVINQDGCLGNVSGQFVTPQFANVSVLPAPDCPGNGNGEARVEGLVGSGNGGIGSIIMDGIVENITVPFDTIVAPVGNAVSIRLIDQMGCYRDTSATITSVGHDVVIDLLSKSDVLCYGDNNGSATINTYTIGANGLPDNVAIAGIEWTFVSTGVSSAGPPTFTTNNMLQVGNWIVTVNDANGCASSLGFEIGTPDSLVLYVESFGNPSCNGLDDGSINLGSNGGIISNSGSYAWTGPITISSTSQTAINLPAGNYFMSITDDNGCMATASQTIDQPPQISGSFNQTNIIKCYGDSTGFISTIGIVNAVEPIYYSWDVPGSNIQLPSTSIITDLPAGEYNLQVVDNNGCQESWLFTIGQADSLYFDNITIIPAYCRTAGFQNGRGKLSVSASGGTGSPKYKWTELNTGSTTPAVTWASKNPGPYNIFVSDFNGCTISRDVFLDSINPKAAFQVDSDDFTGPAIYEGTEPIRVRLTNQSTGYFDPTDPSADVVFDWTFDRDPVNGDPYWFFTFNEEERVDTIYTGEQNFIACLAIKNYNDCVDTSCVEIISRVVPELILPNVFTPGGDSNNDEFFFPNMGINEFKAIVFNRYGVPVFEFNEIGDKWDGTNKDNGKDCSDGVYFYTYEGSSTNGTEYIGEGTVTLLRNK